MNIKMFWAAMALLVGPFSVAPIQAQQSAADPNPAMNNSDKFAWDLFIEVNRPALAGRRGVPDPNKKLGDPGPRVWETWKITTRNGNEVFLEKGKRPPPWDESPVMSVTGKPRKFMSPPKINTIREFDLSSANQLRTAPILTEGQEFRINRIGFEFIVNEGLYSLDGQERFRDTGREAAFPIGAINVKATWRRFTPEEVKAGKPSRILYSRGRRKSMGPDRLSHDDQGSSQMVLGYF